ncbi:MAG: hypothetical protein ACI97A_000377 [Planctomycetota bacterium]|jgi:hypothetical protein
MHTMSLEPCFLQIGKKSQPGLGIHVPERIMSPASKENSHLTESFSYGVRDIVLKASDDPMDVTETITTSTASPFEFPIKVRTSAIHGKGVFASALILSETLIGSYDGPRVNEDGTYVLWIDCELDGVYGIDGCNDLKYTNHSPTPNATFEGPELIALRDIMPGEEITFHYGDEWADSEDIDYELLADNDQDGSSQNLVSA